MVASTARADRLLDLPSEHVIAFGRLALVIFALAGLSLDPAASQADAQAASVGAAFYGGYALLCLLWIARRPPRPAEQAVMHGVDVAAAAALMQVTRGPMSPFFVFFTFILLAATVRWNWRGAVLTAALLLIIFVGFATLDGPEVSAELDRTVLRSGWLLVAGAMLAYFGAYRERSRRRLAELVAWPAMSRDAEGTMAAALRHVADLIGAREVWVLWEDREEPYRRGAFWRGGEISFERDEVNADTGAGGTLAFAGRRVAAEWIRDDSPLPAHLKARLRGRACLTAPFMLPACCGRLFLVEPRGFGADELLLTDLIAMRVGVDLGEALVSERLEMAAASAERARLGRNLHDGVLQTLTAANLQLKVAGDQAPASLGKAVEGVRRVLTEEQRRVRAFVENNRTAEDANPRIQLAEELELRLERLGVQWRCDVGVGALPPDLTTSRKTAGHIGYLVSESTANAVRHGGATRVRVSVHSPRGEALQLVVQDNGSGFAGLAGAFDGRELRALGGPRSLLSRVAELGGRVSLQTGPAGSELTLWVPNA